MSQVLFQYEFNMSLVRVLYVLFISFVYEFTMSFSKNHQKIKFCYENADAALVKLQNHSKHNVLKSNYPCVDPKAAKAI